MQLVDAISWGVQSIKASKIENPHLEALVILSHLLDTDKSYLYSNLSMELSPSVFGKFSSMIEKRAGYCPLAYLTGRKEFMSLNFLVNENVMIPRPETEILVEETLKLFPQEENNPRIIVDIGTGCGNIALSLAKYNKNSYVYATDISLEAVKVAFENRKRLKLENSVSLIDCNLWDCFDTKKWEGKVDVLVSNPPYIPSDQLDDLAPDLSYEPKEALDGGENGIYFYPFLVKGGEFLLRKGGYLVMEMGVGQREIVESIVQNEKVFEDLVIKKDYDDIDRVIIARRK
jgi:release factor glutamine methyltransferase